MIRQSDWLYFIIFLIGLFSLVLSADFLRKKIGWQPEAARKFVHIFTGIFVALTPFLLTSKWPMIILGILFTILDYIAVKHGLFRGMHGTHRITYGTVFYPVSFVILVLLLWDNYKLVLVAAMLIMALADAAAAVVGGRVKNPVHLDFGFEEKSIQGSAAMFVTTFIIVVFCLAAAVWLHKYSLTTIEILWFSIIVSIIATVCEVISLNGSDNLTVPLGAAFILHYLLTHTYSEQLFLSAGMILSFIAAVLSYKFKFLDTGGSLGAFLLGTVVFGIGRWAFTAPILTFFILSSIISKAGKKRKEKLVNIFEKSGKRDIWQVIANGGVAGILVLIWNYHPNHIIYLLYIGSLAAVMADTWGTEIGVMSRLKPISVLTLKTVPMGTSGGITLLGTAGATLGAFLVTLVGWLYGPHFSPRAIGNAEFVILVIAGVAASLVDSILGATIQAKYACPVCEKITERKFHCENKKTRHHSGFLWVNNDVVNVLCALSGIIFIMFAWWIWLR